MSESQPGTLAALRRTDPATGPSSEDFEYVCDYDDMVLDEFRSVEIGGREVCVVRTLAGVFAIGSTCPHQAANMCAGAIKGTMEPSERNEYRFAQEGEIVTCPWHGYEFSLRTGASVGGALKGRLGAYQVEVRDGAVYCSPRRVRPERPVRAERPTRKAGE
ncbi:nitrite reductase (NAD(P)H) small subunit [Arthrobacter sp. efr-133-TYG-118]|uniref:Rieske (2Fe-2S) protein n=1 Tax=Arthrobacter sp. efr-133-TYG-118 TaxID=3040279 RepID=UPI00254F0BBF|nr:nitrite reductase (NAD(P)H) small subunit [Arthrobacter sp. efr-133-TYG-118]